MSIKGQLAVATMIDGNRQIMPIQWGIAPVESMLEWRHFFVLLKEMYGEIITATNIFFIGDRQKGSRAAFEQVFGFLPNETLCSFIGCQSVAAFGFPSENPGQNPDNSMCAEHRLNGMEAIVQPPPEDMDENILHEFDHECGIANAEVPAAGQPVEL